MSAILLFSLWGSYDVACMRVQAGKEFESFEISGVVPAGNVFDARVEGSTTATASMTSTVSTITSMSEPATATASTRVGARGEGEAVQLPLGSGPRVVGARSTGGRDLPPACWPCTTAIIGSLELRLPFPHR